MPHLPQFDRFDRCLWPLYYRAVVDDIIALRELGFSNGDLRVALGRVPRRVPFNSEESVRAMRLARLADLAETYIGSRASALDWLRRRQPSLGGIVPLETVRDELRLAEVVRVLSNIAYGGVL